ncbi:Holliday junction branch migration protein RuvA [uncultured Limosilactobacillus sp.]|uniref:Holliday junction branch migration protein RuvA n=1 Tax=uncultured Limosilactobacillus sp. TaxID=2837629 RepID=UPI0025D20B70|nr:Holliday junction branch migration protein RuvA [uncultured Limosilactobacillus sp.]
MYEYLTGLITAVKPTYIVIDVQGVGYQVHCPNPYHYQVDRQHPVTVYIYQSVSDSDISLYGLVDEEEKQLFLQLLAVSGIGPKSALAILASPDHQGLIDAIANNDVSYLTKFPGIGKKTAGQIILDLQGKIQQLSLTDQVDEVTDHQDEPALLDALAALRALGYQERVVSKMKKQLAKKPGRTTDEYLREGLHLLN